MNKEKSYFFFFVFTSICMDIMRQISWEQNVQNQKYNQDNVGCSGVFNFKNIQKQEVYGKCLKELDVRKKAIVK